MIKKLVLSTMLLSALLIACNSPQESNNVQALPMEELLIGTYTADSSKGIYNYVFDPNSGELNEVSIIEGIENPSYIVSSTDHKHFYSVIENDPGYVAAFQKDSTGKWTEQNRLETMGAHPCHLSIDKTGKWLFVANYSGGNLAVIGINNDGSLSQVSQEIKHIGSGPNKDRQQAPHVHSVNISPDNKMLYVADLGTDELIAYSFDDVRGELEKKQVIKVPPGSGPRHLEFNPAKNLLYVICELSSSVAVIKTEKDSAEIVQIIATLPEGSDEENYCADIHLSKNGKFLYGSNRLHDTIVVFEVATDGLLKQKSFHSTLGSFPRNFAIDPSGKFLLVANQRTNNIVVYDIDQETGAINPKKDQVIIPSPVCLEFIQ